MSTTTHLIDTTRFRPDQLVDGMVLTVEEYVGLPTTTRRCELIEDRVVILPDSDSLHARTVQRVESHLRAWNSSHGGGGVLASPLCHLDIGRVARPDIGWAPTPRLHARHRLMAGAPDLTVEVRRNGEQWIALVERATEYLARGAHVVWLLDPVRRRIEVHTPEAQENTSPMAHLAPQAHLHDEHVVILESGDDLSPGDWVPGLLLPIHDLFD